MAKLCNNYNIYKNTLYLPYPYTEDDALDWIDCHLENFEEDKAYEFAITDKVSGDLFGAIALSNNKSSKMVSLLIGLGKSIGEMAMQRRQLEPF